jgi:hypothetical protein
MPVRGRTVTRNLKETFQLLSTIPVEIDLLKIVQSIGDMVYAVSFSILAEIPSRPDALLASRESMMSCTSSSEHNRSAGQLIGSTVVKSSALRGETAVLKLFLNLSPSRVALLEGEVISISSLISNGILEFF